MGSGTLLCWKAGAGFAWSLRRVVVGEPARRAAARGLMAVLGDVVNGRLGAGTLGSSCTPYLEPCGPLVTRGPYAFVRHMYAGQLLLAAGVPFWFGQPSLLALTGVLLVVLLMQVSGVA